MRLAFLHKSGIYLAAQSTGRFYELQEYPFHGVFFPYSESDIAAMWSPRGAKIDNEENYTESYTALVKLGENLSATCSIHTTPFTDSGSVWTWIRILRRKI